MELEGAVKFHGLTRMHGLGRAVPLTPLPELQATLYLDLPHSPAPTVANGCESAFAALNPAFIRFSSGTTGQAKGVISALWIFYTVSISFPQK